MTKTQRTQVNGKFVRVNRAGQNFGWFATIEHQNGRVIASTDTYPFESSARSAGEALAAKD